MYLMGFQDGYTRFVKCFPHGLEKAEQDVGLRQQLCIESGDVCFEHIEPDYGRVLSSILKFLLC